MLVQIILLHLHAVIINFNFIASDIDLPVKTISGTLILYFLFELQIHACL